jgi:tRNA nucleotidyltransferase (CCA-adding enzyme)
LPVATRRALRWAVSLAEQRGDGLYLVGGGVRDLLLGGAHADVDLLVEGDALALASALAAKLKTRVVLHPRFGTAVVQGERFRLDVAQARTERYERPGALPSVRPARLADDLARRDFTVNAMALRLGSPRAGQLIDPHGGREDLAGRRLRVLHDASFQDDATRIPRALRYAGRLQFRVEPHTQSLLRRDLSYLDTISGARLRHEFERIASEEEVGEIVRLASRLGVIAAVHEALRAGERELRAAGRLSELAPSHRDAVLLCLLLTGASPGEAEGAIARLALTGRQADAVRGFLALREEGSKLARASLRPSDAVRLLSPRPPAAIEAFALVAERPLAAERARRYLEEWRFLRPRLNGRDVEALGVPHGPQVGAALASLREARLDGRTSTREDEVALIRRMQLGRRLLAGARHG